MNRINPAYLLFALTVLALAWSAALSIPNTFVSGEVISAAEMNANFAAVANTVSALEAQVESQAAQLEALATALPSREGYFAYAWVDATSPSLFYSFNPAGDIVREATATGAYTVTFWTGAGPAIRNVMVAAYGTNAHSCKVRGWTDSSVFVRCYDAAGAPANSLFTIWVTN